MLNRDSAAQDVAVSGICVYTDGPLLKGWTEDASMDQKKDRRVRTSYLQQTSRTGRSAVQHDWQGVSDDALRQRASRIGRPTWMCGVGSGGSLVISKHFYNSSPMFEDGET